MNSWWNPPVAVDDNGNTAKGSSTLRFQVGRGTLFVWLLIGGRAALAQVNAEPLRKEPVTSGWSGTVDGSFAYSHGNVNVLDVGAVGRIQRQSLYPQPTLPDGTPDQGLPPFVRRRALFVGNVRFAERVHDVFINQGFAHLRFTEMWGRRLGTELVAQYQFNEFLRLRVRALAAAGLRVEAVHLRHFTLSLSTAYMFEYEHINVDPGASDQPVSRNHRLSNSAVARVSFSDRYYFQNALFYQPRIDDFRDFRFLNELEMAVALNAQVAVGLLLGVLHDSQPPTGVKPTDLRVLNTLKLSF